MRLHASLASSRTLSLSTRSAFGTTLADKKDGRAFFGRHYQLRTRLEFILTSLSLNVECE
jgi:hypothetical protein